MKFGIVELYERPLIYTVSEDGRKKRWKEKRPSILNGPNLRAVLKALIVPPVSLAVWFGIISFFVMIYLTAGLGEGL